MDANSERTTKQMLDQMFRPLSDEEYNNIYENTWEADVRGSTCQVYKAKDVKEERLVALKQYKNRHIKHQHIKIQVIREIEDYRKMHVDQSEDSQYIIKLYDCVKVTEQRTSKYVIVTQYCDGGCLQDRLLEISQFPNKLKLQYCLQIAKGLRFIHSKSVLHRDIKPQNILIKIVDGKYVMKIADLGSSRQESVRMTVLVGTLLYMSPQRMTTDSYGKQCDMYALGVTFFQILTGNFFFSYKPNISYNQFFKQMKTFLENFQENIKQMVGHKFIKLLNVCVHHTRYKQTEDVINIIQQLIKEEQILQNKLSSKQQQQPQKQKENNQAETVSAFKKKDFQTVQSSSEDCSFTFPNSTNNAEKGDQISTISQIPESYSSIKSSINFGQISNIPHREQIYDDDYSLIKKSISEIVIGEPQFKYNPKIQKIQKPIKIIQNSQNLSLILKYQAQLSKSLKNTDRIMQKQRILIDRCRKIQLIKQLQHQINIHITDKYILVLIGFLYNISYLIKTNNDRSVYTSDELNKQYGKSVKNIKSLCRGLRKKIWNDYRYKFTVQNRWILNQTMQNPERLQQLHIQFMRIISQIEKRDRITMDQRYLSIVI